MSIYTWKLKTFHLSLYRRSKEVEYAWEDIKSLFNGGSRKRVPRPNHSESLSKQKNPSLASPAEQNLEPIIQTSTMVTRSLPTSPPFIDLPTHYSNILGYAATYALSFVHWYPNPNTRWKWMTLYH